MAANFFILDSEEKVPPSLYACTPTPIEPPPGKKRDHMEVKLRQRPLTAKLDFSGTWYDRWVGNYYTLDSTRTQLGGAKPLTVSASATEAYEIEVEPGNLFRFVATTNGWQEVGG